MQSVAALLRSLEAISARHPDRVLRLRGQLAASGASSVESQEPPESPESPESPEPFELLIFRGFSCSITHPTASDPDQPALPEGSLIEAAELLRGPLNPAAEQRLAGPAPVTTWLEEAAW